MKAVNILWDVDEEVIDKLPTEVNFPDELFDGGYDDAVADYLSDKYGFCVLGFVIEEQVKKRSLKMAKVYDITIKDSTGYYIKANSEEEAVELALEWFSERKPDIEISVMTDKEINEAEEEGMSIFDMTE